MKISLQRAIEKLYPGAIYHDSSNFISENESDFNDIEWVIPENGSDIKWTDVEKIMLTTARVELALDINQITNYILVYTFRYSKYPSIPIIASMEWQFNVQNLFLGKDTLTYPYHLKFSEDEDLTTLYGVIESPDEFDVLYSEIAAFITVELYNGRLLKNSLVKLDADGLTNFKDTRLDEA